MTTHEPPSNDDELVYWLRNMRNHGFTPEEESLATGLPRDELDKARRQLPIAGLPFERSDIRLLVLPYPGGRHPRIGFLEGAIDAQRGTKVSVFAPWKDGGYFVVDVPEAIWSNLGLTYLAHKHVLSIWDQAGIQLPSVEWTRNADGTLEMERRLPNGISFGTRVTPREEDVLFNMTLTNGTDEILTDLRVQNCVMLKGAPGFTAQTNDNKIYRSPFAAVGSDDCRRWAIVRFDPVQRCWGNPLCPCLHSDPQFPDCEPGSTVEVAGYLRFYLGENIEEELSRLKHRQIVWRGQLQRLHIGCKSQWDMRTNIC